MFAADDGAWKMVLEAWDSIITMSDEEVEFHLIEMGVNPSRVVTHVATVRRKIENLRLARARLAAWRLSCAAWTSKVGDT